MNQIINIIKNCFKLFLVSLILGFNGCKKPMGVKNALEKREKIIEINKENSQINFLRYTEDFADLTWDKKEVKIKNNATFDPNGNPTADMLDLLAGSAKCRLSQTVYKLEKGFYAFSVFVKALEGQKGKFTISVTSKEEKPEWRNVTEEIEDKEWKRIVVKIRLKTTGDIVVYTTNGLVKNTKNDLKQLYMWGAQLEKIDTRNAQIREYLGVNVIR